MNRGAPGATLTTDGADAAGVRPVGGSRPPTSRRFTLRGRSMRLLVGGASLVVGALLWQLYGLAQENNLFIPTFTQTVAALADQVMTGEFWRAYAQTLVPFAIGWLVAIVVGVAFGVALGVSRILHRIAMPYLSFLNALPVSALVPLVVIAAGIDTTAGATLVFLFAVVDVVLTSAAGVRYVDSDMVAMARSFGMSARKVFLRVTWPAAMPGIMAAVRIGTGRAIVGMVVMELLLVSAGVGKLVTRYKDNFESADLYAVVMSLGIFGLVMLGLTRTLERRVLRWQPSRKQAR